MRYFDPFPKELREDADYAATPQKAIEYLTASVVYMPPDGTQKECGNRCMMHVEEGENKDRCTIHAPDVFVPDKASCCFYIKGPAAPPDHPVKKMVEPEFSGLVYGEVTCKNCDHANEDSSVCNLLTSILKTQLGHEGAVFNIAPDGCCNLNTGGSTEPPEQEV